MHGLYIAFIVEPMEMIQLFVMELIHTFRMGLNIQTIPVQPHIFVLLSYMNIILNKRIIPIGSIILKKMRRYQTYGKVVLISA